MPPNVLSTYIRMEKEENERNKKEEYERIQTTMLEGENDVQKICRDYKIKLEDISIDKQTVLQKLQAFCVNNAAFQQFKKDSTIHRTLHNYHKNLDEANDCRNRQKMREEKAK